MLHGVKFVLRMLVMHMSLLTIPAKRKKNGNLVLELKAGMNLAILCKPSNLTILLFYFHGNAGKLWRWYQNYKEGKSLKWQKLYTQTQLSYLHFDLHRYVHHIIPS